MKRFIIRILEWIDDNINHKYLDVFFEKFPMENSDGSDSIYFKLWQLIVGKFCNFTVTLSEKWFPEDWKPLELGEENE